MTADKPGAPLAADPLTGVPPKGQARCLERVRLLPCPANEIKVRLMPWQCAGRVRHGALVVL